MDKRKEEIVETAIRRFKHYGFGKTTMNEIAEDLRITKANLYYYYPDKSALIKDVLVSVSESLLKLEEEELSNFEGDFLGTLFAMLEHRANHMREFYIFYINDNFDWIKGKEMETFISCIRNKDIDVLRRLLHLAVEKGVLKLDNVDETCEIYSDVIKGVGVIHTMKDLISGIPNKENVDKILDSQKKATKLIFEERLVTKNI